MPIALINVPQQLRLAYSNASCLALHTAASTRVLEQRAASSLPAHALMQRAGWAVACLALAIAPHAQSIWIACGPGNNGGDGLQAAALLKQWGKLVQVSLLANVESLPADARAAWQTAHDAGVRFVEHPPALQTTDLCIDALLGIGIHQNKVPGVHLQGCISALQASPAPVLSIDIPSGLLADTGAWAGNVPCVRANHTISLLTLKPGLFTAHGRDAAGCVWFHDLAISNTALPADAWLQGASLASQLHTAPVSVYTPPAHNSHKGCFGDVCVIGGAQGMQGAALLAGEAALFAGAGRVYAGLLHTQNTAWPNPCLMVHSVGEVLPSTLPWKNATVAAGCGGGKDIALYLPDLLQHSPRLVLDADAINAIAVDQNLVRLLHWRAANGHATVLTPHPLEAARLLRCTAEDVQQNRMQAAQQIATQYASMVVLKGSGSICALPICGHGHATFSVDIDALVKAGLPDTNLPVVNYSGNARLATAGTGDVLTGCIAAYWAQMHAEQQHARANATAAAWQTGWRACCTAVHAHGDIASQWNAAARGALTAQKLAQSLHRPSESLAVCAG